MIMDKNILPGQIWTYNTMKGYEDSRIVIGSIDDVPNIGEVICISIIKAPIPKNATGAVDGTTMPFLPFSKDAVIGSILKLDGSMELHKDFESYYYNWLRETKGEDFLTHSIGNFLELIYKQGDQA